MVIVVTLSLANKWVSLSDNDASLKLKMTGIMHSLVFQVILGMYLGTCLVRGAGKTSNTTSTTTTTALPPDLSGESTNLQRSIYLAPGGEDQSTYSNNGNDYGQQGPSYERNEYGNRVNKYQQSSRSNGDYYKEGETGGYHQNQQQQYQQQGKYQESYRNPYEEQNHGKENGGYGGTSANGANYHYEVNSGKTQSSYQSEGDGEGEPYPSSNEDGYDGNKPQYMQYAYEVSSKSQQTSYTDNGKSDYTSGENEQYSQKEQEYYPSPKPTRYVPTSYQEDGYGSSGSKEGSYIPEVPKQAGYISKSEEEPSYLKNTPSESYSKQAGYSAKTSETDTFLPMLPKSGHFHEEDGSKVAFFIKHLGHKTAMNNYGGKERKGFLLVPLVPPEQMEIKLTHLKADVSGGSYEPNYQEEKKPNYQERPSGKGGYVQQEAPIAKYPADNKGGLSYGSDNKYPVEGKVAVPYDTDNKYPVQTKEVTPYDDGDKYTPDIKVSGPYDTGNKYTVDTDTAIPYDGHKYSVDTKVAIPYDDQKYSVDTKSMGPYNEGYKYIVEGKAVAPYDGGNKYAVEEKSQISYGEGDKYSVDDKIVVPYDTGNKYPVDAKIILPYDAGNKYSVDTKVDVPYSNGYKYPDSKIIVPYDTGNKYSVGTKIAVPYSTGHKYPVNTKVEVPYTADHKYSLDPKISVSYGSTYGKGQGYVKPRSKVVVSQEDYGVFRPIIKHSAYVDTHYQSPRVHSYSTGRISGKDHVAYVPKTVVNYGTGKEITYSKPSLVYGGRQAVIRSYTGGVKYEPISLHERAPEYVSPYDITSHKSVPIKATRYYQPTYRTLPRILDAPGHSNIPSIAAKVQKSSYGKSPLYSSNYGSGITSRYASPKLETSLKREKQVTILLQKPSSGISLRPSSYSSRGRISAKTLVEDFGLHGYETLLGHPKDSVSSLYYDLHAFPSNHRYSRVSYSKADKENTKKSS